MLSLTYPTNHDQTENCLRLTLDLPVINTMKREVVQEFLGLPGIIGLVLMDGRSRPCFYGVNEQLNFQQKEALAQGICQIIETTPSSFKTFEFQFSGIRAYIYKLVEGMVLLVLVENALPVAEYREALIRFKQTLEDNVGSAVSTLRYLAGAQSQVNKSKAAVSNPTNPIDSLDSPALSTGGLRSRGTSLTGKRAEGETSSGLSITPELQDLGVLKDYLVAMNQLSQFAKKYLGTAVIVNYWKSTRPEIKWLEGFQIERSGEVSCLADKTFMQQAINVQQREWIREWVRSFSKRCGSIIKDFSRLAATEALSPEQKQLLF